MASRVGILDRAAHRIRSVRRPRGVVLEEMGLVGSEVEGDDVRRWFSNQGHADEDDSYLAFFYRCLDEGSEFYYLYQAVGDEAGWRCGGTTWDTPILGRLVGYQEARVVVEEWYEDLKWQTMRE